MGGGTLPRAEGIYFSARALIFPRQKSAWDRRFPGAFTCSTFVSRGRESIPIGFGGALVKFGVFSREGTSARMVSTHWILSLATSTIIVTEVMNID